MRELVSLLRQFERAQDEAFTLGAKLGASLAAAQVEQQLAGGVTQPVFAAFTAALGHLADGRGATIDGHRSLEKIARVFGIEHRMDEDQDWGDGRKYPDGHKGSAIAPAIAA